MAGFNERALGIFQSLIELNIFCSKDMEKMFNRPKKLENYRAYYEAYGNPHIGDLIKYQGWTESEQNMA